VGLRGVFPADTPSAGGPDAGDRVAGLLERAALADVYMNRTTSLLIYICDAQEAGRVESLTNFEEGLARGPKHYGPNAPAWRLRALRYFLMLARIAAWNLHKFDRCTCFEWHYNSMSTRL
jgi:hypothetical protein